MSSNIRIFGAGKWGLAVAYHLSNQKNKVQVFDIEKDRVDALNKLKYCKDLDVKFNEYIEFHYLDPGMIPPDNDIYNIIAVSSAGFSSVVNEFKDYFSAYKSLIWLTKGIDNNSGLLFHEVVNKTLSTKKISDGFDMCMVSGPSFAIDLVKNEKITINSASNNILLSEKVSSLLTAQNFKVEPIKDIIGVQVASVVKNIAATIAGILVALNYDESSIMSIIEKAKAEVLQISSAIQLKSKGYSVSKAEMLATLDSPACHGDMILTCLNDESRNRQFGRRIGDGESISSALKDLGTVESYLCTKTLYENKERFKYGEITDSAYNIMYKKGNPKSIVNKLVSS